MQGVEGLGEDAVELDVQDPSHELEDRPAHQQQQRQPFQGDLEFMQVLCHDEITRREVMGMRRRLRRARFDQQTTLEEFDFEEELAPGRVPPGRWPAAAAHSLATSQQLAINAIMDRLAGQAGVFAVNGPPGTVRRPCCATWSPRWWWPAPAAWPT